LKTTLLLVRHGESLGNKEKFFAGHMDVPLIDSGIRQAERSAQYVKEHYQVDDIYTSDLMRAYRTAECFATLLGLDITKDSGLREIHAGEWEGKTFDELSDKYSKDYEVWKNHIGRAVCTGGESVKEFGERIMKALTGIAEANEGKTVVVATHATPIRVMQSLIATGNLDEMENIPWVSNASLSIFEYSDEWKVKEVSIDAHLAKLKTKLPDNV